MAAKCMKALLLCIKNFTDNIMIVLENELECDTEDETEGQS